MSAPRGTRTHNFPVKSRLLYAIELERHVFILLLCRLLPANLAIATENPSSDAANPLQYASTMCRRSDR